MIPPWRDHFLKGQVIPALPLALHPDGQWSERHQRALIRYYTDSGAGGLAVGVHSTQFAIREPRHALFEPVLRLAAETITASAGPQPFIRIAGACGPTPAAAREAELAASHGYHADLLSPGGWQHAPEEEFLAHTRSISEILPVIGFYLQTAVGGRAFSRSFWQRFAAIPGVAGIKIAPFNRYQTIDVIHAVTNAGRHDLALYTGNDDNIIADLLTPWPGGLTITGGLLGQWGVWTSKAVPLLREIHNARSTGTSPAEWLSRNAALTDANAAIFDATNHFHGCIPGILEVLRRQGLVPSSRCLDPSETLSEGQAEEISRVSSAYPWLTDDAFVASNLDRWLS
ncbi:MAG: dihydrodipicolinate synthase family protein [Verrucomicrobiota bacterium]